MEAKILLDAQIQCKRMYTLLNEAMDLSRQLVEAADRGDQTTVELLMGMREDPIRKLQGTRYALEQQRDSLPQDEGRYLAALLNGGAPQDEAEKPLAAQVAQNQKLLKELIALDERLSHKLLQEKSVYAAQR